MMACKELKKIYLTLDAIYAWYKCIYKVVDGITQKPPVDPDRAKYAG